MHDLFMYQSQASAYDLQIGSTWCKTYEGRNTLIMQYLFLFKREKDRIDCLLSPILSSCCCYASQAVLTWYINAVYNDNKVFYLIYLYYSQEKALG